MNQVQKIAKNSLVLISSNIISLLLFLVLSIFIARKLGALEFGKWSFAHAFAFIFVIITHFGIDLLIIRDVAADKSKVKEYFYNGLIIKIFLSVFVFILMVLIINILDYPPETKWVVYIIGAAIIFNSFCRYFYSVFRAFERMELEAFLFILVALISSLLGLTLLFMDYSIKHIALAVLVAHMTGFVLGFCIIRRKFAGYNSKFNYEFSQKLIKKSLPFFGILVLENYVMQIDQVMLSIMNGNEAVGFYSVADKLIMSLGILFMFVDCIFPIMSKLFSKSKNALLLTYKKAVKYLYVIVLPVSIGVFMLADKIILLIYGYEYLNSVIVLQILSIYFLFLSFLRVFNVLLISMHRLSTLLKINICSVIFLTASNYFFIYRWGYNGLAVSNLLVIFLTFIVYLAYISKKIYKLPINIFYKPIIAVITMSIVIYLLNSMNLFLIILASVFVYFGCLLLIRNFSEEDYRLIKRVWSNSK
ncbi:MAG: flippase [Nanoarchaeota archaeon]